MLQFDFYVQENIQNTATDLVYFWRGIEFFEEVVSGTPLVLLNTLALGLIGVNLLWWTIGQVGGLVDDLMQI